MKHCAALALAAVLCGCSGAEPHTTDPESLDAADSGGSDSGATSHDSAAAADTISSGDSTAMGDSGPSPTGSGIWADPLVIKAQPTTGAAWNAVVAGANSLPANGDGADVANQDSNHDQYTLAAAIACVRTESASDCDKARAAVLDAIGTEQGGRWLAVGRNVAAYVIAADLLGLRADGNATSAGTRVETWIRSFLTMKLAHNNDPSQMITLAPFPSGSNASAQEGFVYAAVAAYARDKAALDRVWDAFRTYACDPTAPDRENIDLSAGVEYGWAHNDTSPCAVNPLGTKKVVPTGRPGAGQSIRIDGAIINDIRRGDVFQHPPVWTAYPWVGLEGFVPAAVILHRAGYPAFQVADRAVFRAMDYLSFLRQSTGDANWFDGRRAAETIYLVNLAYKSSFTLSVTAVGGGRTVGYVSYTHPNQL